MATNSLQPAHALNRFLWSQIETEGIMTKTDYATAEFPGGIVPIVPVEETPQLIQTIEEQSGIKSLPYIVYTWTKVPSGVKWFLKTHDIAYAVRSADAVKINKLINLFDNLFKDYDDAARRVNAYIATNGTASQKMFIFKYLEVQSLGGQMPAERENGVNESLITIRATFTGG